MVETGEWMKMFAMSKPSDIVESTLKIAGSKRERKTRRGLFFWRKEV